MPVDELSASERLSRLLKEKRRRIGAIFRKTLRNQLRMAWLSGGNSSARQDSTLMVCSEGANWSRLCLYPGMFRRTTVPTRSCHCSPTFGRRTRHSFLAHHLPPYLSCVRFWNLCCLPITAH